jgi:hypothetical protein
MNMLKAYKYMESKVHNKKQQMLVYWEQSISRVHVKFFDTKEEDEDCERQKPQMQSTKVEEQMEDLAINKILIFDP